MKQDVRSYIAELLGTFTLVFVGTAVAALQGFGGISGVLGISLAFGFTLMVLVWTLGPVSGCHINPAVTIAMMVASKISVAKGVIYIIAQVVGALIASLLLRGLISGIPGTTGDVGANGNPLGMTTLSLLLFEVVMTALFLLVILSATRDDAPVGFAGLAIGGFLFVAHLVGAQLGDASLNPARSLGPALVQGGAALDAVWIFIVGPIVGAVIGWILYRLVRAD